MSDTFVVQIMNNDTTELYSENFFGVVYLAGGLVSRIPECFPKTNMHRDDILPSPQFHVMHIHPKPPPELLK